MPEGPALLDPGTVPAEPACAFSAPCLPPVPAVVPAALVIGASDVISGTRVPVVAPPESFHPSPIPPPPQV